MEYQVRVTVLNAFGLGDILMVLSRIGSLFALVVKITLTSAVWFAYTQRLWRRIKQTTTGISLSGLDAAFSAETTMMSLLNLELILKMPGGALLALLAW